MERVGGLFFNTAAIIFVVTLMYIISKTSCIYTSWANKKIPSEVGPTGHLKRAVVHVFTNTNQLRLAIFPIIYKVFYIPGGAGFQPSTVVRLFFFVSPAS